ncbi:unnamed protein product [Adineta steineri]|uniref:LamG-like jellyroll fold domain-containing protein n=1 Tax=Adineta steineri TaxID=433720 RepID=A0A814DTV1_9BILA|nr:unnamed protein product [Adineta steineri]
MSIILDPPQKNMIIENIHSIPVVINTLDYTQQLTSIELSRSLLNTTTCSNSNEISSSSQETHMNEKSNEQPLHSYKNVNDTSQISPDIDPYNKNSIHSEKISNLVSNVELQNITTPITNILSSTPFINSTVDQLVSNSSNESIHITSTQSQTSHTTDTNTLLNISESYNTSVNNQASYDLNGFYYLGQTNYPYSFSLWIYPFVNNGTILQVSSSNGWCVPMIGFDISGRLTIQTMGSNGIYAASLTFDTLSLNQWTHVIMTYSTINGIQLFINGTFMVGNSTVTGYSASGQISTITIGTCLSPDTCAVNTTTIVQSQFQGKIDELQIFARELSLSDIGQLAQETTLYTSGPSSFWQFDNNTLDSISNFNGEAVNSPIYLTSGITGNGYALQLIRNNTQYVTITTYQNFSYISFTVEMWIYPTLLNTSVFYALFSQRDDAVIGRLLHLKIKNNRLYMGFYSDDLPCSTALSTNTWYHVAFVYDYRSRSQMAYLNGNQDCYRSPAGPYSGVSGAINIGTYLDYDHTLQCFDGYIDNVALSTRTKTDSEILTDATLTTWHSFDSIPLQDSGPLGLITKTNNVTLATGKVNQALSFNSSSSYYQIQSFVLLGISNYTYSIALWVKRTSTGGGTLVHLSTQTDGLGWCVSLLGFRSTGEIVATNWDNSGKEVVGSVLPINVWTHVASTFSTINGLRFYINGVYSGTTGVMSYGAAQKAVILTLGNPLVGGSCNPMSIATGVYFGSLDEFRVYSREVTAMDVYGLANP